MNSAQNPTEVAVQKAFSLLIQIRGRRQAKRLLDLANSYLHMLARSGCDSAPMVVSVRAVRIREP